MHKKTQTFLYAATVLFSLSIVFTPLSSHALNLKGRAVQADTDLNTIDAKALEPKREHARTILGVISRLKQMHYKTHSINDDLSSKVFDLYIDNLDSTKSYFLASDIEEFEQYRYHIDEALRSGNLKPAFHIFNRYQSRVFDRLKFLVQLVENSIDDLSFEDKESLQLDRDHAPWPNNLTEMDSLWHKRLKSSVLNLKLAGKEIEDIQSLLSKRYRNQINRSLQTNSDDAFQTYVDALTQSYDPHTQYFSPRTSEDFNIHMSLSLEGIGAVLQTEDEFTKIIRLVPAGPADKSQQLAPADRIIAVAQGKTGSFTDVVGWRLDEVVQLIRGKKKSLVRLEIIPANANSIEDTKIVEIVRNTVKLEEQSAQKSVIEINQNGKTLKIGVIDVPTFYLDFRQLQAGKKDYKSTTRDVIQLISELKEDNIDGLVIDLRNNGGGSLQEANSLTGLFIQTGPTVQVRNSNGDVDLMLDSDPGVIWTGPLAVLVNRMSASASEIFAGAIQDYGRGLIIGGQTFGKGTVQSLIPLNNGQLKLTLAKFYRISGESNQNRGIIPDIAYPTLFDIEEIGESALSNALPWDTITPVKFRKNYNLKPHIAELKQNHKKRIKADPDFIYLSKQINVLNESRSNSSISLNEASRKLDQKSKEELKLQLENERRLALGLETLVKLSDIDEEQKVDKPEKDKNDFLLQEAGKIITDYISLNHFNNLAHHNAPDSDN